VTKKYEVLVYTQADLSEHASKLNAHFQITVCHSFEALIECSSCNNYHFILIDVQQNGAESIRVLKDIKQSTQVCLSDIPVVLLVENISLETQISAYEVGVDDCISTHEVFDVIVTRLQSTIFNGIANKQLKTQLKAATDVAMTAMSNTSDLGCNIQFLLDSHQCENFDQLGQLLFQSLNHYGLKCSLQMRGRFAVKNMEANGMEKTMESQLLSELKDKGRFFDFGYRTIVNYSSVSLLVKNMPLDDDMRYGIIKDNIFALVQGVEARIKALDTQSSLLKERQMQANLLVEMKQEIQQLDESYKALTNNVAGVVNTMATSIEDSMATLLLTDAQELVLHDHLEQGRNAVCDYFEKSAGMDDGLKEIIDKVFLAHELNDQDPQPSHGLKKTA
jgi:CheY-like chemotaxis protein